MTWMTRTDRRAARWPRSGTTVADAATSDAGMTTAEYAVGTVAACGFGGLLYKILTSDEVQQMLRDLIARAFSIAF